MTEIRDVGKQSKVESRQGRGTVAQRLKRPRVQSLLDRVAFALKYQVHSWRAFLDSVLVQKA